VVENGVPVGRIRSLELDGDSPVAELQLFHDRFLAEDTRFVNFSHSLMGARKVWMLPGASARPLDETAIQDGLFAPGLPETLHKVNTLVEKVAEWREQADRLLVDTGFEEGTSRSPFAAQQALEEALQSLGALSASLDGASAALQAGLAAVTPTGDRIADGLRGAEAGLDGAVRRSRGLLRSLQGSEAEITALLDQAERIAGALENTTGAGRLLTDRTLYESLVENVEALTAAARLLRADGLGDSLKVRPRFR
jgi:ABC-type transporter Mla subunit MlaD